MSRVWPFFMAALTPFFQNFRNFVLAHLSYTTNVGHNVHELDGEVEKLKRKRLDVEDQIKNDERARKKARREVEGWLVTAAKLEEEAASIRSKYQNRSPFNCFSNHYIGVSSREARAKVEVELRRAENFRAITKDPPPLPVQQVPTATLGEESGSEIQSKLDRALDFLRNSSEGKLGIWGMGGVGKTTLLRHINNALAEDPSSFGFHRVVFVTASRGCTTQMIRELIAKALKLTVQEAEQEAHAIFNYLKNKSFVILLDDLWERLDLENVGVPTLGVVGEVKHKLIIATRFQQVSHSMDARLTIKVHCLSREKARQLFKEKVGEETIRSHPLISGLADTVADECGGLPLARIAIARAMTGKRLVNLWVKAIKDLRESKPSEISGTEDPLALLKISYDYLNDPVVQECLLLCALWPEDYNIKADKVIKCWMGHNLLGEFANLEEAYNNGYEIIDRLQKASLLEYSEGEYNISGEGRVSLHDLVRDMALWIARDVWVNEKKWMVHSMVELEEAHNNIVALPSHIQSVPNLTTLMFPLIWVKIFFNVHGVVFLRDFHALKYLDISGSFLEMDVLIAICKLDKLEYLNLANCDIHTLPEEIKDLKSLKYLFLEGNQISEVSSQVLSNLVSLEVLHLSATVDSRVSQSSVINNLDCLKRRMKSLGINVCSQSDLDKLARLSAIPIWTLRIFMAEEENLTSRHLLQRPDNACDRRWSNLNDLHITGDIESVHHWLEELVIDESDGSLPSYLHLDCLKVKEIVWKGVEQRDVFPKLRDIILYGCDQLKHVSWIVNLPLLERLHVNTCKTIEHVVCEEATETEGDGEHKTATLPSLKILDLFRLPELESICNRAFTLPFLQNLHLYACPRLKKLPFDSPASCSKLRKIVAQEEGWTTLELDDDMRTYLQPFLDIF